MILTILGTHEQQFDRLLKAVDALDIAEPRIVQTGYSRYVPQHCTAHEFLPFEQVESLMKEASVVITHAGTGTVMLALSLGKTPIVVPRLAKYGEHVDDHQIELVESLGELDLIIPLMDGDDLAAKIALAKTRTNTRTINPDPRVVAFLQAEIDASV